MVVAQFGASSVDSDLSSTGEKLLPMPEKQVIISQGGPSSVA